MNIITLSGTLDFSVVDVIVNILLKYLGNCQANNLNLQIVLMYYLISTF